jgi:ATP-binding cassette subfamily B protein/subfamily B ATP-binding cassette protein MsbA
MKNIFRVFTWVRRYPVLALSTLGCAIVSVLCGLVFPKAVQQILDVVIPQRRGDLLGFWVMMTLAAYFARDLLNGLRIFLNNTFEQKVIFDLRSDLYARLQRLPLPWFDGRPTGDIMTTVAEDVTAVERVLIDGIEQGLVAILQVVVFSVWLFSLNASLGAIALLPIPLLAAGALVYTLTAKDRYRGVRKATSFMNSLLMDNIGGIRQIKAYTREQAEHTRFNAASERLRQATIKVMRAWSFYNPAMMFIGATGSVLVLWFGGRQVLAGTMMPGELTSFLVTLALVYEPIGRLHSLNQIFQAGRAASERFFDILDAEEEESLDDDGGHQVQQPVRGHVEYRNVSFAYNERIATLSGVSLEARPGETVALVGPTGAGKSTIINLLCRFYELPKEGGGEIVLDGHSIRDITKSSLRGAIGYVTQESFLFNGTIRDNLLLARPNATTYELWSALESANAKEFVQRLPQQLDTEVGERGVRLSVGEKQRVSIARALLKNPPILLLDEATASVDTETERQIQQALDHLMEGRTSFVIAHRLSTVRHAHRIYVLDQGRVVEQGTHDTLLARPDGLYAELCKHSFLIEKSGTEAAAGTPSPAGPSPQEALAAAAAKAAREAAERERAAVAQQLASLQREQAEGERARATLETELAHALAGRAETESAATRAAAETEAERLRLARLDHDLAASEASRLKAQEELLAAQQELSALRAARDAIHANRELEQAAKDVRIDELEAELTALQQQQAAAEAERQSLQARLAEAPAATGVAGAPDEAAAEAAAARKRLARVDRDLAASEASRLKIQEDLLAAQEELSALRAAHDAGRADHAVEEDEKKARLAELEAELAELRRHAASATEPPRHAEARESDDGRLAELESELASLRQQLAGQEKRRLTLEAELAHVRAANEKLEAGLPVAPLPAPNPAHPELPLQLPPSRPLVVYTSRGL